MKKNIKVKIHTVPQKCGYYHSADDFWLSLLKTKTALSGASPEDKTAIVCSFENFLTEKD